MVNGFTKSEEGVKAYQKIGQVYPNSVMDTEYEKFIERNSQSPYSDKNTRTITRITRVMGNDDKEYIIYSYNDKRYNALGNEDEMFCPEVGMYPIPIPRYEMRLGPGMQQRSEVAEIIRNDVGFAIPFSTSEMNKLKDDCVSKGPGKTQYYIQYANENMKTVKSFEALRDGDFFELKNYGQPYKDFVEEKKAIDDAKRVSLQAKTPEDKQDAKETLQEAGVESGVNTGITELEPEKVEEQKQEAKDSLIHTEEEKQTRRGKKS
jgi:hypothetical protein